MPYVNNVFSVIIYDVGRSVKYYAIEYAINTMPELPPPTINPTGALRG